MYMRGDTKSNREVIDFLWLLNNREIGSLQHLPQCLEIILNQGMVFYELN